MATKCGGKATMLDSTLHQNDVLAIRHFYMVKAGKRHSVNCCFRQD